MNKEFIDKHEAYLLLKQKAETYMLPATKEAYEKAARLIDSLPTIEAEPVNGWISVKDRLPPYGERVLVINEAYGAEHRYTKYNIGVTVRSPHLDFTFWGHKVTHWQPLPKPPKEDKE